MNKKAQAMGGNIMTSIIAIALGLVVAIIVIVFGVKVVSQTGASFEPDSLEANLTAQGTGLFQDLMDNLGLVITISVVVLILGAVAGLAYLFTRR